jgi:hypothetical protein
VFVTKLNPAGSSILYSTYVGGAGNDRGDDLFVGRISGAAYAWLAAWTTLSVDFPATPEHLRQPIRAETSMRSS